MGMKGAALLAGMLATVGGAVEGAIGIRSGRKFNPNHKATPARKRRRKLQTDARKLQRRLRKERA